MTVRQSARILIVNPAFMLPPVFPVGLEYNAEVLVRDGHAIEISAELGEICAGTAPGRAGATGVTIFKSLGLAVEDVASARIVVERARARGVGTEITV